jgi:hypothetical protein
MFGKIDIRGDAILQVMFLKRKVGARYNVLESIGSLYVGP